MIKNKLFTLVGFLLLAQMVSANVRLHTLFADHMVIQRETNIPVWGWADAGETVSVSGSWGEKAETITGADGTWKLTLKTPKAGGPFTMTIAGEDTLTLNDVLAGEVWFCTGQSNMDFSLSKFVNKAKDPKYQPLSDFIKNEIATANDPWLRHIEVNQTTSLFEKKATFDGHWISAEAGHVGAITATGYFFAKELRKELNVPIGLVECDWGGTRIQPWISEAAYMDDEEMKAYFLDENAKIKKQIEQGKSVDELADEYKKALADWELSDKKQPKPTLKKHITLNEQLPATLYNGMVSAVIPYAIKGTIWYQGESNRSYMSESYEKYFRTLINSWRKEWAQGDFPFYWVQLANFQQNDDRSENGWAVVDDHLRRALSLPNTGMAALYDIGEATDIHPHNKMETGRRLALLALKKDYHKEITAASGPLYKRFEVKRDKIKLEFDEVGTGLMVGKKELANETIPVNEPLKWFQIAGEDGQWKTADAIIISNNKIEVSSKEVAVPKWVRYAWASNPEGANLYNKEGLPAAIFTTKE